MPKKYNLRKEDTVSLKEGIHALLDAYRLNAKFDETKIIANWERIIGKVIANRTERVFINNGVLFLKVDSPTLKQELLQYKNNVLDILNKEAGKGVVTDVKLL